MDFCSLKKYYRSGIMATAIIILVLYSGHFYNFPSIMRCNLQSNDSQVFSHAKSICIHPEFIMYRPKHIEIIRREQLKMTSWIKLLPSVTAVVTAKILIAKQIMKSIFPWQHWDLMSQNHRRAHFSRVQKLSESI